MISGNRGAPEGDSPCLCLPNEFQNCLVFLLDFSFLVCYSSINGLGNHERGNEMKPWEQQRKDEEKRQQRRQAEIFRSHYTMTFENPLAPGGCGIVKLLLNASEVKSHAQALANVFQTKVVTEREGFKFDTEPQTFTNPHFLIVPEYEQENSVEILGSVHNLSKIAQNMANEQNQGMRLEQYICGTYVVRGYFEPEEGEES